MNDDRQVPFIDSFLPEEVLFSLAARLKADSVISNPRVFLERFFGSRNLIPSADLPTHLDEVFIRFGKAAGYSDVADLIERATLYPYFRFFMAKRTWDEVLSRAAGAGGMGLKTRLGIVANRFGASAILRSCPDCLAESIREFGSTCWIRSHLLPGVQVCAIHGTRLNELPPQSQVSNRHELFLPQEDQQRRSVPNAERAVLLGFARLSQSALMFAGVAPSPEARRGAYVSALAARGWIRGKHHVRWDVLDDGIRRHFQEFEPFDFKTRLGTREGGVACWLQAAVGPRTRQVHPICHLLLIDFLFGGLSSFVQACKDSQGRGTTTLDASGRQTETQDEAQKADSLLRQADTSCSEVARVLGLSVTTVIKRRQALGVAVSVKPKTLSPKRLASIRSLLSKGRSIATVADRAGVSPASVYRVLASQPHIKAEREKAENEATRKCHRAAWLRARAAAPSAKVSDLRVREGAAYAWLRRHDREWLRSNLPDCKRPTGRTTRVDWLSRDLALANRAAVVAAEMHCELGGAIPSPMQVLRAIYKPTSWYRHRAKLPLLEAVLRLEGFGDPQADARLGGVPESQV